MDVNICDPLVMSAAMTGDGYEDSVAVAIVRANMRTVAADEKEVVLDDNDNISSGRNVD